MEREQLAAMCWHALPVTLANWTLSGHTSSSRLRCCASSIGTRHTGYSNACPAPALPMVGPGDDDAGVLGVNVGANKDSENRVADYALGVGKAAAVADYRPLARNSTKIKKSADSAAIELVKNPDILAGLGAMGGGLSRRPFLVGFAAETDALGENATKKLKEKNLDMIVANDVSQVDAGFNVDTNRAVLFFKDGSSIQSGLMSKDQLAGAILDHVVKRLAGASEPS